jgi:hypothetical protein
MSHWGAPVSDEHSREGFERAVATLQRRTGLTREQVIAEAVAFASLKRGAFRSHLHRGKPNLRPIRRFIARHFAEIAVASMFLLGAALAALQIMQPD